MTTPARGRGESLGSSEFKADYGVSHAYVAGGMYRGIASTRLVVRMAKAGMLSFFGSGGLPLPDVERAIVSIKAALPNHEPFGINVVYNPSGLDKEKELVKLLLRHEIRVVEAAAFMTLTPALVHYRAKGLHRDAAGRVVCRNRIIAKLSRPEVAGHFLSPAPEQLVAQLLKSGEVTPEEARMLERVPMADDICAEADSAGHTDRAVALTLIPTIRRLRDRHIQAHRYDKLIRVGAAGGIGTPEAAAAAFVLGADFITTGSINQCTVEAGASDAVKDLLQDMNIQDSDFAPAGDMFEYGAQVQVLKRGVFFPARARKLYELYMNHRSLDEIDPKTRRQIEDKYFSATFDQVWEETQHYLRAKGDLAQIEKANKNGKHKMSLVFKWFFARSTRYAFEGDLEHRVNFQIHTGPALGAFNQWVKGTELERWSNRNVDHIAKYLMDEAAQHLWERTRSFVAAAQQ